MLYPPTPLSAGASIPVRCHPVFGSRGRHIFLLDAPLSIYFDISMYHRYFSGEATSSTTTSTAAEPMQCVKGTHNARQLGLKMSTQPVRESGELCRCYRDNLSVLEPISLATLICGLLAAGGGLSVSSLPQPTAANVLTECHVPHPISSRVNGFIFDQHHSEITNLSTSWPPLWSGG